MRAHTVQRAKNLNAIARQGHVYCFRRDESVKADPEPPRLIGVNVASTITGFCQHHDAEVFAPIDRRAFEGEPEQAFLLAYRSLCYELYAKQGASLLFTHLREGDRGRGLDEQLRIQTLIGDIAYGNALSLRDLEAKKRRFDELLISRDFSSVSFFAVGLDRMPDIVASGAVLPECSFAGEAVQDLRSDDELEGVFHNLLTVDDRGAFVLTWLAPDSAPATLADSLRALPADAIPHAIVRFLFEFCENMFLAPAWWDRLEDDVKGQLAHRYWAGVNPQTARDTTCLLDEGIRAVDWRVAQVMSHGLG